MDLPGDGAERVVGAVGGGEGVGLAKDVEQPDAAGGVEHELGALVALEGVVAVLAVAVPAELGVELGLLAEA